MRLFLLLLFLPLQSFAQSTFSLDTINHIFLGLVNEYRLENNLNPYELDRGLSPFVLQHCENMKKIGVTHGESGTIYSFRSRWSRFILLHPEYREVTYRGENLAGSYIPLNGTGDISFSTPYTVVDGKQIAHHEFDEILPKVNDGNCKDSCIAQHIFYQWKSSPGHNRALLDPEFNKIYLGIVRNRDMLLSGLVFIQN